MAPARELRDCTECGKPCYSEYLDEFGRCHDCTCICEGCEAIVVELFQVGSALMCWRCRDRRARGNSALPPLHLQEARR